MSDIFQLTLISASSLSILIILISILFAKTKWKISYLLLIILFSILPIISTFRKGIYESGDQILHISLLIPFYESLSEGLLNPIWTDNACSGYGCPIFNYYYKLPYYLASGVHWLGFNFTNSIKILMSLIYVLSGISMFLWIKDKYGKNAGIVAAVLYQFAPYHLVSLHYRTTLGESLAFGLLPLIMIFVDRLIKKKKILWYILLAVSFASLVLTHLAITIIFSLFLVAYIVFQSTLYNKKPFSTILLTFISIAHGGLLASYYWIPAVLESNLIHQERFLSFPKFWEFFTTPWYYGLLSQGSMGELGNSLGYAHWIMILVGLLLVVFRRRIRKIKYGSELFFFVISFILTFTVMQKFTRPIWLNIPFLTNFQSTHRLLLLLTFISSIVASIVISNFGLLKKFRRIKVSFLVLAICLVTMYLSTPNWGYRRMIKTAGDDYGQENTYLQNSTFFIPVKAKYYLQNKSRVETPIEILRGDGEIINSKNGTHKHEYTIVANSAVRVKENTLVFPGWTLYVNGKRHKIIDDDDEYPGIVVFTLPKGFYKVKLEMQSTKIRLFSLMMSRIGLVGLISIYLYSLIKSKLRIPSTC